jgi:hypothetical protein
MAPLRFVHSSVRRYIDLVETYIERRLKEAFSGFEMEEFMQQLQQHEEEMDGSDVLEVLLSLGDFPTFKDIMLSYKADMAGSLFHVDVRSSVLHLPQVCSPNASATRPHRGSAAHRVVLLCLLSFRRCSYLLVVWDEPSRLSLLICHLRWGWGAAWTNHLRTLVPLTRMITRNRKNSMVKHCKKRGLLQT